MQLVTYRILVIIYACLLSFPVLAATGSVAILDADTTFTQQNQHYDLIVANTKVGDFNISKTTSKDIIEYNAKSLVEINFFGKLSFEYTLHCVYTNNELTYSEFMLYRNGKLTGHTVVNLVETVYKCSKDGETFEITEPIFNSAVQLYFEEPKAYQKILSEKEGSFIGIEEVRVNDYQLVVPENDRDITYTYLSEQLQSINVDLFITEFKMVRD